MSDIEDARRVAADLLRQELADAATTEAADEGVSRAEWIRSAMRARLRTAADA